MTAPTTSSAATTRIIRILQSHELPPEWHGDFQKLFTALKDAQLITIKEYQNVDNRVRKKKAAAH